MRPGNLAIVALLLLAANGVAASDLTITVGGDLLRHGGVVTVYPVPVAPDVWARETGGENAATIALDSRYTEVQLRYPSDATYTYRFRPAEGTPDAKAHGTQVLSVIGTDENDRGPQMKAGFTDAWSSGGRIIRVPSLAEVSGPDETTRTMARWGETEGRDAVPPADERSARALLPVVEFGPEGLPLQCAGDGRVQVCTIARERWPLLEARWWRSIAEQRLERLRDHALRRCYDSTWLGGGTCTPDPQSDEPAYIHRK